jgi:hypothetical protein
MNRRNFLKSMGALAATAASATSFAAMTQPNKYSEAIRLLDACRNIEDPTLASARADMLLTHLREHFPVPEKSEANIAAARVVLDQNRENLDEAGIRGIPPSVADEIYPIALFRLGLILYKLPIDPDLMKNFVWFHHTYGMIILTAVSPLKPKPKPRTAEQVQNDNLVWVNRQADPLKWSPTWEEDMKLFNIKGRA